MCLIEFEERPIITNQFFIHVHNRMKYNRVQLWQYVHSVANNFRPLKLGRIVLSTTTGDRNNFHKHTSFFSKFGKALSLSENKKIGDKTRDESWGRKK